jgi:hypothetical protein
MVLKNLKKKKKKCLYVSSFHLPKFVFNFVFFFWDRIMVRELAKGLKRAHLHWFEIFFLNFVDKLHHPSLRFIEMTISLKRLYKMTLPPQILYKFN